MKIRAVRIATAVRRVLVATCVFTVRRVLVATCVFTVRRVLVATWVFTVRSVSSCYVGVYCAVRV
jgi:hypothetical protein